MGKKGDIWVSHKICVKKDQICVKKTLRYAILFKRLLTADLTYLLILGGTVTSKGKGVGQAKINDDYKVYEIKSEVE